MNTEIFDTSFIEYEFREDMLDEVLDGTLYERVFELSDSMEDAEENYCEVVRSFDIEFSEILAHSLMKDVPFKSCPVLSRNYKDDIFKNCDDFILNFRWAEIVYLHCLQHKTQRAFCYLWKYYGDWYEFNNLFSEGEGNIDHWIEEYIESEAPAEGFDEEHLYEAREEIRLNCGYYQFNKEFEDIR